MSNGAAKELFRKFKEGLSKVHDKGVQGWKSLVEERIVLSIWRKPQVHTLKFVLEIILEIKSSGNKTCSICNSDYSHSLILFRHQLLFFFCEIFLVV